MIHRKLFLPTLFFVMPIFSIDLVLYTDTEANFHFNVPFQRAIPPFGMLDLNSYRIKKGSGKWYRIVPAGINKGTTGIPITCSVKPGATLVVTSKIKGFFKTSVYKQEIDTRYARGIVAFSSSGISYKPLVSVGWLFTQDCIKVRIDGKSINRNLERHDRITAHVFANREAMDVFDELPWEQQKHKYANPEFSCTLEEIAKKAGIAFHELEGKLLKVAKDHDNRVSIIVC